MERGSHGVFPHELARAVILAELRWRNPARLKALTLRAQRHYAALIASSGGSEQLRLFVEFSFILGHDPRLRAMSTAHLEHGLVPDTLRPGDEPHLCAMVLRHEGATSERYLRHWLACQPTAFKTVRNRQGGLVAFGAMLRLDVTTPEQRAGDPVVSQAWDHARRLMHDPASRPIFYTRYMMAGDTYQEHSPAMAVVLARFGGAIFLVPGVALAFSRTRGRPWEQLAALSGAYFAPELRHESEGHVYEVSVQDHRDLTLADWLESMSEKTEMGEWGPTGAEQLPPRRPPRWRP